MILSRLGPKTPANLHPRTLRWAAVVFLGLLAVGWATACGPSDEELAQRMEAVRAELAVTLEGENLPAEVQKELEASRTWRALRERYGVGEGGEVPETVWVDGEGPRERVDELIAVLSGGGEEGANGDGEATAEGGGGADDYGARQLVELRDRARTAVEEETAEMGRRLAELELAASHAFLTRAFHAIEGRVDPRRLSVGWHMEGRKAQPLELLNRVQEGGGPAEILADLAPRHEDYRRLREARERYRAVADRGGWPQIPETGEALEEGARGPRVAALRERLVQEGDLAEGGDDSGAAFDGNVARAVRRFQERHGLEADGVVGGGTLEALNVPAEERLRTIELNLERWHWMAAELGDHHVVVNIPEYRLRVMRDGETELTMDVIVGKRMNQTPVFSDIITHLVLNPAWHIPRSIAGSEVVPKLLSEPGYAERQGIEVVGPDGERMPPGAILGRQVRNGGAGAEETGEEVGEEAGEEESGGFFANLFGRGDEADGADPEADPEVDEVERITTLPQGYRLRQAPGPLNPLGQVKFMFPNEHNIYLHDTPTGHLFDNAERGFSHGCIRLERPLDLAEYLLQGDPDWGAVRIRGAVGADREINVPLPREIPVHLTYFTAWVGNDGIVHFRDDLYGHDESLAEALAARESPALDLSRLRRGAPAGDA